MISRFLSAILIRFFRPAVVGLLCRVRLERAPICAQRVRFPSRLFMAGWCNGNIPGLCSGADGFDSRHLQPILGRAVFMKKRIKHGLLIALSVVLILTLNLLSVASAVVDSSDLSDLSGSDSGNPIFYTEGYTPGMYRNSSEASVVAASDVALRSAAAARYGSYSYNADNVYLLLTHSSTGKSDLVNAFSSEPSISASSNRLQAVYTKSVVFTTSDISLFVNSSDSTYFDFSSSDIAFTQSTSDANKFLLNGTFNFTFGSFWNLYNSTTGKTVKTFNLALYPVAVQPLIDGKPYGDPVDITTYTNGFTGLIYGSPSAATVSFSNYSFYFTGEDPELFGFRIYVDCDYNSTEVLTSQTGSFIIYATNSLSWTQQPTISFSVSDSGIYGQLDDIKNLMRRVSGYYQYLAADGSVAHSSTVNLIDLVQYGFVGLRNNSNKGFSNLASWLETINNSLSIFSGASAGVDKLVSVFARDDDIQLRDDVDSVIRSASESFFSPDSSTAVTSGKVTDAKNVLEGTTAAFHAPYSPDAGFYDFAEHKDIYLSWFSSETFDWLDSTVNFYADDGAEDPFNHWRYDEQMHDVQVSRGEGE